MEGKVKRSARETAPGKAEAPPEPSAPEPETPSPEAIPARLEAMPAPSVAEQTAQRHEAGESTPKPPPFSAFAERAGRASAALARSQSALVQGLGELSIEMTGFARSGVQKAAKRAGEALAIKTLSDAVDLQLGLARDGFEAFVGGPLRLSELGIEIARKTAEPLWSELLASAPRAPGRSLRDG
jgi:hypothetical protein